MDKNYYYKILGVTPNASKEEIESGFHRVIKIYHPDNGVKNDEMIKDILNAYNVLSDEKSREQYDREQQFASGQDNEADRVNGMKANAEAPGPAVPNEKSESNIWNLNAGKSSDYERERRNLLDCLIHAEEASTMINERVQYASSLVANHKAIKGAGCGTIFLIIILGFCLYLGTGVIYGLIFIDGSDSPIYTALYNIYIINPLVGLGIWSLVSYAIIYTQRKKNNDIKQKWNEKEDERIKKEKEAVFHEVQTIQERASGYLSVLPPRFQYKEAFRGIRELIEDRRVDSLKEALNLYETERYQKDMVNGIRSVSASIGMLANAINEMEIKVTVY